MRYTQEQIDALDLVYACTSCGDEIDTDHDYCSPCDQRGGEWEHRDADGEPVDISDTGLEAAPQLVKAVEAFLARLEEVCKEPEMQIKADRHGNEAARLVRSGVRTANETLRQALHNVKRGL